LSRNELRNVFLEITWPYFISEDDIFTLAINWIEISYVEESFHIYGMIFQLPDILTVDFNSVDECDSLYTCKLHNYLYFIPRRKPINKNNFY